MCGIAGIISKNDFVDHGAIERMRTALAHRGPDGNGTWFSESRKVGFAHTRLAIIDITESASQPMICPLTGVSTVFNGEIYNHRDLRVLLEKTGAVFRTDHSDTEVLLNGYIAWGISGLLSRINGMFSFAVYDPREESVYIARDRVGIKPLYFAQTDDAYAFASEAKALLVSGQCKRQLNKENAWHFLAFRSLPAPMTLFEGVSKFAPSSFVRIDVNTLETRTQQYWSPFDYDGAVPGSWASAEQEFTSRLEKAISLRMAADTNVGVFLSGGLDSTYILDVASELDSSLSSFTARYPQHQQYDEGANATESSSLRKTSHHNVPMKDSQYAQTLLDVAYFQDEPIAAPICVPVYLLSEKARNENVPVILAGEGADEVLLGYTNWLRIRDVQKVLNSMPDWLSRATAGVVTGLTAPIQRAARVHEVLGRAVRQQPIFWGGAMDFTERMRNQLAGPGLAGDYKTSYEAVIAPIWKEFCHRTSSTDVSAWMSFVDIRFRLPELMLPRLDKMGMACSIEGRVPFLDHQLIEFIFALPPHLRNGSGREGKQLLKRVAANRLGSKFVYQKKRGFQAPVKEWRETPAFRQLTILLIEFSQKTELFRPEFIQSLLSDPKDRLYFTLVNFMLWYCIFIENVLEDALPDLKRFYAAA